MACLDLHYYVTVHENLKRKTEEKETHVPVTLGDLRDGERCGESDTDINVLEKGMGKPFLLSGKVIMFLLQFTPNQNLDNL